MHARLSLLPLVALLCSCGAGAPGSNGAADPLTDPVAAAKDELSLAPSVYANAPFVHPPLSPTFLAWWQHHFPRSADAGVAQPQDAGTPAPVVEDAGSPAPVVEDAGSPAPVVVDAGTPAVEDAGPPAPVVVDAGTPTPPATSGVFRAFSASSPWNIPAAQKGTIDPGNPYQAQFEANGNDLPVYLSGTPEDPSYSAPVYFAQAGDPVAQVTVTQPSWLPQGDLAWNGQAIPVPAGVTPATGSDGHLTVVSADKRTAWDFWGCTQAGTGGYVTQVIAQWDLTGPGYATQAGENSARGSGAPLISTSLRGDEALSGFDHAMGFTVPFVSPTYLGPIATHSDGTTGGSNILEYGMLFVLRADYPIPSDATIGEINMINALKTYGAYLVDQGSDFGIDVDSSRLDLLTQAGVSASHLNVRPSDMRYVHLN